VVSLRPREFMGEVLLPLLHEVGERWHSGRLGPVHEHIVSEAARRVLLWLIDAFEAAPDAPVLVATTVSGELHEFGAMAVSAAALEEGWRVVYLGSSLPASEIVRAVRHVRASVIALSMVNAASAAVLEQAAAIVAGVSAGVFVVAGGAGADASRGDLEAAGVHALPNIDALRELLRARRPLSRSTAP
jgi:MerR family transcriptional regulator, light-induced transcriptional regulator